MAVGICPVRQFCHRSGRLKPVREVGVLAISTPEGYRALDDQVRGGLPGRAARASARGSAASPRPGRCARSATATSTSSSSSTARPVTCASSRRCPMSGWSARAGRLDLKRAWFEHRAASIQSRHAAQRIPELLHFDERLYLIAMECCRPHVIMRRGMIEGVVYPEFAAHIAEYLATTLYYTSDMALPAAEKRELVAAFSRQHRAVQDHRGPDLHRPLHGLQPQPLDQPAARRRRGRDPRRCRPQARGLGAQAEVPGRGAGPAARRPAHRLDHGDGRGHQGDRPGVRGRWGRWASTSASSWATCC